MVKSSRSAAGVVEQGRQTGAPVPGTQPAPRSRLVLAVILAGQLMVVLDTTIVNVALPKMQHALKFSSENLSWVLNAYTLAFGGLLLLGARLGDVEGRRRTFVTGIGIFTFGSLLGGLAPTSGFLLAARALQGVGAALAAPSSLALLTTMYSDARERVKALALFSAVSVGGGALGLVAGGALTQWASWRWVMFVNVPIGVCLFVMGRAVLPETTRTEGRFDLPGAVLSTLGMGSLVYGFVHAVSAGWASPVTIGSFVVGVVLLLAFALNELHAVNPITPLHLLADRGRTSANVARGLLYAGMFGMFFFLTQFLQDVLGYGPLRTGLAFLPMPIALFAGTLLTSKVLIHRIPAKVLMLTGMAVAALGFLAAARLTPGSGYGPVLASLLLFAAGNRLAMVPLTAAALAGVAPENAGAASGLVNVTQQLGGSVGVAILVNIFGSASRHAHRLSGAASKLAQAQHQFTVGTSHAFVGAAMFLLAAFVLIAVGIRSDRAA